MVRCIISVCIWINPDHPVVGECLKDGVCSVTKSTSIRCEIRNLSCSLSLVLIKQQIIFNIDGHVCEKGLTLYKLQVTIFAFIYIYIYIKIA